MLPQMGVCVYYCNEPRNICINASFDSSRHTDVSAILELSAFRLLMSISKITKYYAKKWAKLSPVTICVF